MHGRIARFEQRTVTPLTEEFLAGLGSKALSEGTTVVIDTTDGGLGPNVGQELPKS